MSDSTINIRPPVWLPIVVVLIAAGAYIYGQQIASDAVRTQENPATISVDGTGRATANPDVAMLTVGYTSTRQSNAKQAMDMVSKKMNTILDAVKQAGVPEKDIQLESLSLQPEYDWSNGSQRVTGYMAQQSVSLKIHDLDKPGDVIAAATDAGANQIGNVAITIDDPDAVRAEARTKAIAEAKAKAEKLASELGVRLVRITSFSEGGMGVPAPMYYNKDMMMESRAVGGAVAAPTIPTGDQEVNVSVNLTFEVE
jgi:uncharacterized protein YggE